MGRARSCRVFGGSRHSFWALVGLRRGTLQIGMFLCNRIAPARCPLLDVHALIDIESCRESFMYVWGILRASFESDYPQGHSVKFLARTREVNVYGSVGTTRLGRSCFFILQFRARGLSERRGGFFPKASPCANPRYKAARYSSIFSARSRPHAGLTRSKCAVA